MPLRSRLALPALAVTTLLFAAAPLRAATYYVDPASGHLANPGTASSPWSTLEAVFAANRSFAPGDVILLRSGYHGTPTIKGRNTGEVLIQPQPGHTPRLRKLLFSDASRWTVEGLDISPLHAGATSYDTGRVVEMLSSSSHITLRDCRIRSVFSVAGWTEAHWASGRLGTAVFCRAPYSMITGNEIQNVGSGITVYTKAVHTTVSFNVIDTIRDDGFRALANDGRFEYNTLTNMYAIDANHDDALQSWSNGPGGVGTGVISNVQIRGNVFISYVDPQQPWKAAMQGIGLFDGMYEGWVIENNLIVTDQWHGIALYGARNCRIVNNTVVKNPVNARSNTPWIQISPHKNGTPSTGNVVHNNLTTKLNVAASDATLANNLITTNYAAHFVDWAGFDLHLKPTSTAIAAGTTVAAPSHDADLRPRSVPIDIGAYESSPVAASVSPPVASLPAGTYQGPQTVTLSTTTSGATIRYTTDGSTPSATSGQLYTSPLTLSSSTTVKAIAAKEGLATSSVMTASYTLTTAVAAPVISGLTSRVTQAKNGSFEITWRTDQPARSEVRIVTGGTSQSAADFTLRTDHRFAFKGTKGATYSYTVSSANATGGSTTASGTHRN